MNRQHRVHLLLTFLVLCMALTFCTEVTTTPSNVTQTTTITPGGEPPEEEGGNPQGLTVTLEPSSVTVAVGDRVFVQVIVKDQAGNEVPNSNLTAASADTSIATVALDGSRFVRVDGVASGTTSATIVVNGLSAGLPITVTP